MKNDIELLEQELNAPIIEYKPFQEYTLGELTWNGELTTQEINMNPYSLSFFIKSLFCGNSSAVFVSSFLNFFQELTITTLEETNPYSISSNAAIFYILKILEKNEVVKIIEFNTKRKKEDLGLYRVMKKTSQKRLKEYNVLFYKLRDLDKTDTDLLNTIERPLRIPNNQLKTKFINGEMYIKLSRLEFIKCIFTGHFFIQFKKNLKYWKKAEGFKNDISTVLYNLTINNKPTTK